MAKRRRGKAAKNGDGRAAKEQVQQKKSAGKSARGGIPRARGSPAEARGSRRAGQGGASTSTPPPPPRVSPADAKRLGARLAAFYKRRGLRHRVKDVPGIVEGLLRSKGSYVAAARALDATCMDRYGAALTVTVPELEEHLRAFYRRYGLVAKLPAVPSIIANVEIKAGGDVERAGELLDAIVYKQYGERVFSSDDGGGTGGGSGGERGGMNVLAATLGVMAVLAFMIGFLVWGVQYKFYPLGPQQWQHDDGAGDVDAGRAGAAYDPQYDAAHPATPGQQERATRHEAQQRAADARAAQRRAALAAQSHLPQFDATQFVLAVELADLYAGTTQTVRIDRQRVCQTCGGHGAHPRAARHRCAKCRGTGHVEGVRNFMGFRQRVRMECGECGGRGWNTDRFCPDCANRRGQPARARGRLGRALGTVAESAALDVAVPAGAHAGQNLVLEGEGHSEQGSRPGNVVFRVKEVNERHPSWRRGQEGEGRHGALDLHTSLRVSLLEALNGFDVQIKHLDGHAVRIDRSDSITRADPNEGDVHVVPREGMPDQQHRGFAGDLRVRFNVDFPRGTLTRAEKALVRQLLPLGENEVSFACTGKDEDMDAGRC